MNYSDRAIAVLSDERSRKILAAAVRFVGGCSPFDARSLWDDIGAWAVDNRLERDRVENIISAACLGRISVPVSLDVAIMGRAEFLARLDSTIRFLG